MQVSRILTKLSAIYFQKKDLSNSVLCANAALGASRKFYGDIAVTYLALMKAKYQSGDMKSALECFKYSMNILHYHLSENHPLLIDSYNEIAHLYQRDGNIQYALKFFTKALELCKKVLGGGHWKTAWCFFNVGRCHSQSTNFQEALVMMENGLVIISSLFGEKRLATSIFHFYAADILIKKGDLSTAKEHSMKSLETQKYVNQLVQESNQLRTNGIVSTFKDSLENQSLKRNQAQIEDNILQVAYVHENLSEFLEANDFYQSALEILKDMEEDNVLEQIQHITRTIKVDQIQGKSQTLKFPITKELFEMVVIELFDQDSLKVYVDSLFDCVVQNGDKEALKKLKSLYLISIGEDLTMFN
ncbi:tetratricopeptide repeat protein [Anaeramoeba ignava]|uniref:Tetratricopeptide repeat protein n=1 Tax=Anaeramoeba ignava TaxID=1746090 RepID=A0A9Q0LM92_ANAIG|nr:tetratricopeptide repeat protein [Anaeramoeba ignava]